jgi:hypothetical protein
MDLEEVWRLREEIVYPSLFGKTRRGIFPLTHELFKNRFGQSDIDPRWLTYGVFEFAPIPGRPTWIYVTSGHSNPWEEEPEDYDPEGFSGYGAEFIFEVTEQGDWAIRALQSMLAFDILLSEGRFEGREAMSPFDRIPLRAPINGEPECEIRNLMMIELETGPSEFSLPSGRVTLVGFLGLTDGELAFAKANDSETLLKRFSASGCHGVTDPNRKSLV